MAGAALLNWAIVALAAGSTVVGGYVAYQAYRGFRRNRSRPMQLLAVGLFLLTGVSFVTAFVGSVLLRQGVIPLVYERPLTLVTRAVQFLGVLCIAYSLHQRG